MTPLHWKLQVVRAILIAVCYPLFKYFGYPMDWRTAIIFTWSGLRGAVGMVMALYILLDPAIADQVGEGDGRGHAYGTMAVMHHTYDLFWCERP